MLNRLKVARPMNSTRKRLPRRELRGRKSGRKHERKNARLLKRDED
jgi:hypothetical protein